jgi:hypothetical protein
VRHFDPSSLYTGTIAVVVAVVFWTYYGALLFLLGGELAQAVELRRLELAALDRKFTAERAAALKRTGATPTSTGTTPHTEAPPRLIASHNAVSMSSSSVIDLRSDTVTRPTPAMRRAMADAEVGDDERDGDPTTRRLEAVVAERLGKEAARFFPSGTMANQAAIWALTEPGTEIYADADSHIVQWEMAGAAALSGVQVRFVRGALPSIRAADLRAAIHHPSGGAADPSLVCVENTHNGGGGAVTPLPALRDLRDAANDLGVPMHLDGARLWNASAASGTSLAEFAACADTVMVSFTKALGAPSDRHSPVLPTSLREPRVHEGASVETCVRAGSSPRLRCMASSITSTASPRITKPHVISPAWSTASTARRSCRLTRTS